MRIGVQEAGSEFIIERLIDIAASQFNFDPVELRLKNIISTLPHNTAFGLQIDSGKFKENIERASNYIDYKVFLNAEKRREKEDFERNRFWLLLETSRGSPVEGAEIRFAESGRIELRVGTQSNGQGHETTYIDLVSERLGVRLIFLTTSKRILLKFGLGLDMVVPVQCTWVQLQ